MKAEQYIRFDPAPPKKKTSVWIVRTQDGATELGYIQWYAQWRCYAFFPFAATLFEKSCLRYIADFCEEQTKRQRHSRDAEPREKGAAA